MTTISFDVVGTPAPQGSKTRMPNGAMVEGRSTAQRQGHAHWRSAVAQAARAAMAAQGLTGPLGGPLTLYVNFRFTMPKSRKKAAREAGIDLKTSAPDLDKLIRSTGDALKEGGMIVDDALFANISAVKYEVTGWTGAQITVRQVTP